MLSTWSLVKYMGVSSMARVLIGWEQLENGVAYQASAHKCFAGPVGASGPNAFVAYFHCKRSAVSRAI